MKKLRVATVGLGWVALHRHLPVMERSKGYEVVGVIARAPGRARSVAAHRGYPFFAETSTLARIEWMRDVEAVTIATPPMSHYSVIKQVLHLGKHVLTEKPFAMTVAEGEELVRLAQARDLRLGIVHNFQFARSTKRLLAELSEGAFGAIRAVYAVQFANPRRRLPTWYEELPLGIFYDESPHLLYLIRLVAGPIELTRCLTFPSSTGLKTPARIDASFRSPSLDCPISLHCNFESPITEWYVAVFGENRLGMVDVLRDIYISLPNDGRHETYTVLRTSLLATTQHWWQHVVSGIPHLTGRLVNGNEEVFARFHRAINGAIEDLAPIGPESALAVLRLQHAIVERQEIIVRRPH
jgi:predicted dehydrogenase